jgi:hypothetical protein
VDGGVLAGRFRAKKQFFERGGQEETSAVDVSGQHYGSQEPEWDLVKVAKRKLRYARNV